MRQLTDKRITEILSRAEICDDSVLTDYSDIVLAMRELQEHRKAAGEHQRCRSSENVQDTLVSGVTTGKPLTNGDAVTCQSLTGIKAASELDSMPKTDEVLTGKSPAPNPIDHGYRPGCECLGCKATVRICAELGGWTPVSECLPEKNGTYQVWNGKHVHAVPFFFGSFQCLNPEQVTHWMPSANPPREAK
ncbi:hypothetical protein [Raoultella terrigena]|uniref:hypothetical protein n=1 Tax=Raoultella terrigena TaxID=577 RepID=UPI0015892576|nr:hypothetical protein [Raoultella terrigena]